MAEFVIYHMVHWMDLLTLPEVTDAINKNPDFLRKYDARYQTGDIVAIREDGADYTERELSKFDIIKVPSISKQDVLYLRDPILDTENEDIKRRGRILKRRKHYLNISTLTQRQKDTLAIGGTITINTNIFNALRLEKSG